MARPISKYFTPVIKKIIDAKKAENIVVDRQFKAVLRAEMLERAGMSAGRSGSRVFDADGLGEAVGGFFRKWKYQLALAPVALVMVLVAVQTFKMPVSVKSDVVVPMAVPVSAPASQESTAVTGSSDSSSGQAVQSAEQGTGMIRTFPGRLVLPADYLQKKQQGGQEDLTAPIQVTGPEEENGMDAVPDETPAGGSEAKMVVAGTSIEPAENENRSNTGTFVTVPPVVSTEVTRSVPQVQQSEYVKKPGTAAGDLPDEMLGGSGEAKVSLPADATPVVSGNTRATGAEQTLPQTSDLTDSVDPATGAEKTDIVRLVEIPTAAVEAPVVPIYYDSSFNGEEKPEFEKDVLAGLMDGKEFSMISITKGEDRVVTVELYLKDGTIDKKLFLKNAQRGVWNEVKYVQRYFFDDSLRYDVSYPFRMDTVNPFQYSNLNR